MKAMSARPQVRVSSHPMILKSFQPHLQLIVVNNNLAGTPASVGAVILENFAFKKHFTLASVHARHDHERRSSRSGPSSSIPQWTNAVNISSSESSMGFQRQQRYWLVLSRHSQPWKADRRRSAAMRCRSIGYSGLVHSVHQSDQSFSGNRSGCLCKHASMQQPTFEHS